MIELYLILLIWYLLLVFGLMGVIFGIRADKQRVKYWFLFELFILFCALGMMGVAIGFW